MITFNEHKQHLLIDINEQPEGFSKTSLTCVRQEHAVVTICTFLCYALKLSHGVF